MADKRKVSRRDFTYYMQVTNDVTKELLGYLSDISTGGFKLDCQKQIAPGQDFRVRRIWGREGPVRARAAT